MSSSPPNNFPELLDDGFLPPDVVLDGCARMIQALSAHMPLELAEERARNIAAALADNQEDRLLVIVTALTIDRMPRLLWLGTACLDCLDAWESVVGVRVPSLEWQVAT